MGVNPTLRLLLCHTSLLVGCGDSGAASSEGNGTEAEGDPSSGIDSSSSSGDGSSTSGGTGSGGSTSTTDGSAGSGSAGATSGEITTDAGASGGSGGADGSSGGSASTGAGQLPDNAPAPGTYGGDLATLLEANSEMAVAEVNGIIYVLGGYPSSRETQSTVMAYDPAADSWAVVAPLPVPIHHPVAVGYEDLLYSMGGQTDDGDTDRALVYDPDEDEWSDLSAMPTARGAGAGAVIDELIYVVGGRPPAGNAFEAYDVRTDGWMALPDLPTDFNERNHLAAAAIGGKLYVAGGRYDGGSFSSPMTDALDVFDPATNEWTRMANLLRPRGGVNGVAAHGCFHVWGGEGSNIGEPNNVFPDHDVYDPRTDQWTALAPMPTPVHGVTGAAFVNGLIYMPGGGTQQGGSSGSNIFQVYNPDSRCE